MSDIALFEIGRVETAPALASSAVSSQTSVPATTPSALGRGVAGTLIAVVYIAIFLACLLVVSLLEIRQANLVAFNSLVATLEQRDRFADPQNGLDKELDQLKAERTAYSKLLADINCSEPAIPTPATQAKGSAAGASGSQKQKDDGLSCDDVRDAANRHANALAASEEETLFKIANQPLWYNQYIDGISQQAPQIIPLLGFLENSHLFRSPFEMVEMALLVCMGLLGGIIGVIRFFVDPSLPNPSISEFLYKPAAGAVLAFGTFVLFRASQLLLGVQDQGAAASGSTSIFLLAFLGLVSGLCANDAISQIESASARMLRRNQRFVASRLQQLIADGHLQDDAEKLRDLLKIDPPTWTAWLAGKTAIPRGTAQRIADYLHFDMNDAFSVDGSSVPASL
ncbi:MAG TPA: hypothetical protein VHT52_06525 [Stellaceae bacterium]|jgi:hypothetical protein|nr:hypothetical protein [Stellaceae bacterium]